MVDKVLAFFSDAKKPAPGLIGFCTDNPNDNKGMRTLLDVDTEVQAKGLLTYGCVCHALNNFGKDVCKLGLLPKVIEQCKVVCAVFRNVKFAKHHLHKIQQEHYNTSRQLRMPVDTRWNSLLAMLESISRSKDALRAVVHKASFDELVPAIDFTKEYSGKNTAGLANEQVSVAELINDLRFWTRLDQAEILLKPIAFFVTYLEGDMTPISMITTAFVVLMRMYAKLAVKPAGNNATPFIFSALNLSTDDFADSKVHTVKLVPVLLRRRFHEITSSTVKATTPHESSGLFTLAMYLDPATRRLFAHAMAENIQLDKTRSLGDAAVQGTHDMVRRYGERFTSLKNAADEVSQEIASNMDDIPSISIAVTDHPLKTFAFSGTNEAIMAKALFRCPSSAAGGERSFNQYGATHTKKCNRLGDDKLDSLVMIKVNTKQLLRANAATQAGSARSAAVMSTIYSTDIKIFSAYSLLTNNTTTVPPAFEEDQDDEDLAEVQQDEAVHEDQDAFADEYA